MRIVYRNKTGWGIAAREGLIAVMRDIGHPVILSDETRSKIAAECLGAPANVRIFAYYESPIGFWIGVVQYKDQFFAVSAAVRDYTSKRGAEQFRYFSFVYDSNFKFDHLVELPEMYPRCWMLILSQESGKAVPEEG